MPVCPYCVTAYRESIAVKTSNRADGMIICRKCPNPKCDRVVDHPKYAGEKHEEYDAINDKLSEEYSMPQTKQRSSVATANNAADELNELFQSFTE